jgi:hypothetical protein
MNRVFNFIITANSYESELKIEDGKLNICGCRSRSAGACAACRSVFLKWICLRQTLILQSSIENLQFIRGRQIILIACLTHKTLRNRN